MMWGFHVAQEQKNIFPRRVFPSCPHSRQSAPCWASRPSTEQWATMNKTVTWNVFVDPNAAIWVTFAAASTPAWVSSKEKVAWVKHAGVDLWDEQRSSEDIDRGTNMLLCSHKTMLLLLLLIANILGHVGSRHCRLLQVQQNKNNYNYRRMRLKSQAQGHV